MTKVWKWKLPTDAECREILNYILDKGSVQLIDDYPKVTHVNDYIEIPHTQVYKIVVNEVEFYVGVVAIEGYKQNPTQYVLLNVVIE